MFIPFRNHETVKFLILPIIMPYCIKGVEWDCSRFNAHLTHLLPSWLMDQWWLEDGGDCSAVQDQLWNVHHIQATHAAFAAILADGSVVAWGDPGFGGDCSAVQDRLKDVQQIQATWYAFAAILVDGSVVTWGNPERGGDCYAVQEQVTLV